MNQKKAVHHYEATCSWQGSTASGYENYDRTHALTAPPARTGISASSDPAFRGNPDLLNPEQLLVMAAASCQMLSFLAIAARKRINVVEYRDRAEGFMPEDDPPIRITRIRLRPHIVVAGPEDREAVDSMIELAHRHCFIANSLKSDIGIDAEVVFRP